MTEPNIDPGAPAAAPAVPAGHWSTTLPAELREVPAVATAADLPTFVKRFTDQHSNMSRLETELQNRPKIPSATSKPEELKAFKESVIKAGLWKAPVGDDFKITRPERIPEEHWSSEESERFTEWARKHGVPADAMTEGLQIREEIYQKTIAPILAADKEAAKKNVTEQWQAEGHTYGDMMNMAMNAVRSGRFTDAEIQDMERKGAFSHPVTLSWLAKMGELHQVSDGLTGNIAPVNPDAKSEAEAITNDKTHPKYEAYWKGDKDVNEYVQGLWKKAYPGTYGG